MQCTNCNLEIPPARLEILPETTVCVNCSDVQKYRGIISGTVHHKGTEIHIVKADDPVLDYIDESGRV